MANILIVDDDDSVRRLIKLIVDTSGHTGTLAVDAANARRLLAERAFEMIFVDVDMPGETGVELIFDLRQSGALSEEIPVVFVTGHTERVQPLRLMGMKHIAVAAKPAIKTEVRAALKAFLKESDATRPIVLPSS